MNTGRRKILLVEDEPLISMMLEDFLVELEFEVVGTAETIADALALLGQTSPDCAILDVNLRGGETSWPIADALAERGIPFVLATGDDGSRVVNVYRTRPLLQKPFTLEAVEQALATLRPAVA